MTIPGVFGIVPNGYHPCFARGKCSTLHYFCKAVFVYKITNNNAAENNIESVCKIPLLFEKIILCERFS